MFKLRVLMFLLCFSVVDNFVIFVLVIKFIFKFKFVSVLFDKIMFDNIVYFEDVIL